MSDDAAHVDRVPCLQGLGVLTEDELEQMTDANWAELLQFLEVNLLDVPGVGLGI